MSLVNQNDIVFASSLATDKIVAVWEGSFDMATAPKLAGASYPYTTINHLFTRPVFTKSQFSLDGVIWSDQNSMNPYDANSIAGIAYSTSTQIVVVASTVGVPSGTLYYRVIGFWIDDYDTTNPSIPPTTGSQSNVYFDSRINYQKVHLQGSATLNGQNGTTSISHSLGYEPNVRVYHEALPGQVWPANYGGTKNPWLGINVNMTECELQVTTSAANIFFYGSVSSPPARLWYIIYYDV